MNGFKLEVNSDNLMLYIPMKDRKRMKEIETQLKDAKVEIINNSFEYDKKMINIIKTEIQRGNIFICKKGMYFQVNVNNKNYKGQKRNISGISMLLKNSKIDINCDYQRWKEYKLGDNNATKDNIKKHASLRQYRYELQQYITELL